MEKQRKLILLTAIIGAVAVFLPWISISVFDQVNSINGLHNRGIVVLICFVVSGITALSGNRSGIFSKPQWTMCLLSAVLATLLMVIFFTQMFEAIVFLNIGFYLALLSSIALLCTVFAFRPAGYRISDGIQELLSMINGKSAGDSPAKS
ncbi:MAG: hypothetical protein JWQ27_2484 [Ferruginibacter sp.]|nr:hypothetical protein [Ferruginibacter sp.]